jgi:signal transduction histidine kinase
VGHSLDQLRLVIASEIDAHDALLKQIRDDSQVELQIAAAAIVVVIILALIALFFWRQRVVAPLNNLEQLMLRLSEQSYDQAPVADVDPALLPLFERYNLMTRQLAELEQQHQSYQQSLEQSIRSATGAMLEQQRELANTQRLAAVGELALSLTHELRNPLAGIHMALSNLRQDLSDPDQVARMDLTLDELKRITRLLNDLLGQARQTPEPAREIKLAATIQTLFSLLRYQIPETIRLQQTVPEHLVCYLPADRLRQVFLNLILNAAQSIAGAGTPGTIEVTASRRSGKLIITVSDDGGGFPAELLKSGIRPFASWREGGTGLGLTMVYRFAQDLGGELQLTNRTSHGACVILTLPDKGEDIGSRPLPADH